MATYLTLLKCIIALKLSIMKEPNHRPEESSRRFEATPNPKKKDPNYYSDKTAQLLKIVDYNLQTYRDQQNRSAENSPIQKKVQYKTFMPQENYSEKTMQLLKIIDQDLQSYRDQQNAPTENSPIQKKENRTGLPDQLKTGVENLSGYSMDDVKVHYNSPKPAQLQAHAYAQGTDIHLAPGQEKHLPHEAWHVVQQKQGRVQPTTQLKGKVNINDDPKLEREADVMGGKIGQVKKIGNTYPTKMNLQNKTIQNSTEESLVSQRKDNSNIIQFMFDGIKNFFKNLTTKKKETDKDTSLSNEEDTSLSNEEDTLLSNEKNNETTIGNVKLTYKEIKRNLEDKDEKFMGSWNKKLRNLRNGKNGNKGKKKDKSPIEMHDSKLHNLDNHNDALDLWLARAKILYNPQKKSVKNMDDFELIQIPKEKRMEKRMEKPKQKIINIKNYNEYKLDKNNVVYRHAYTKKGNLATYIAANNPKHQGGADPMIVIPVYLPEYGGKDNKKIINLKDAEIHIHLKNQYDLGGGNYKTAKVECLNIKHNGMYIKKGFFKNKTISGSLEDLITQSIDEKWQNVNDWKNIIDSKNKGVKYYKANKDMFSN